MPSIRIIAASAVSLALAAGGASAQTATTTTPGKPLQLFRVVEQKDDAAAKPHYRARYVRRRVARTRVANPTSGTARHAYIRAQPEPDQAATTPAVPATATPTTAAAPPAATTAAIAANIWPTPDLTLPGMEGLTPTPTAPVANDPGAPFAPASQSEVLAAAYRTVPAGPQVAPPTTPEAAPAAATQVAQANTASTPEQPPDATNSAKAGNPMSWPVQRAMVASAEPQNLNPVGSVSWIVHVLAALGATIAAGALAWVLINPLPARSYE